MRGSRVFPLLLLLAVLLVPACASRGLDTEVEYDPDADFTGLSRYTWKTDGQQILSRTILSEKETNARLRKLIDEELARNGFKLVSEETPDFLVGYYVARMGRQTVTSYRDFEIFGPRWRPIGKRKYHEGSLIIDFVNPKDEELMWRGTAQAALDRESNPDDNRQLVRAAVARLLKQFPPK